MSVSRYYKYFSCGLVLLLVSGCSSHTPAQDEPLASLPEAEVVSRASDLNIQLGMAYLREDRFDLAKLKFMRAVELEPSSAKALYSLGYYYEKVGEAHLARESYHQAFEMAPSNPAVQNSYGVFLCRQGQYSEGEALLLKAATHPRFAQVGLAYENAGFCAKQAGRTPEAIRYFQQAISHNPRLVHSYYELAKINFDQGDYQASNEYLGQYEVRANQTIESLELSMKLAEHFGQIEKVATLKEKLNDNKL